MLLKSSFKGYCLCIWHRRKEGWADQSAQHRFTSISFWQVNFVPEQNVLNYTGSSVLMGGKPSSHPHDDPLKLCIAITSLRLEAIVRRKRKCFLSPGHSSTGCWQQQKQSGWKRSWSKKWNYQDTSYESLSPALCKCLTPSLPLASQRSPSDI